ncbi:CLC_0170 family protein [Cohnella sp. 56]|uniref:CLC_0170 family protein n=1 Tax=Cohnella sp. 56 TaxID=3113722 RepID=UPI0030E918C7
MPNYGNAINYFAFSIPVWLIAGTLVLLVDARRCRKAGYRKERFIAMLIGWLDIALGIGFLVREWLL